MHSCTLYRFITLQAYNVRVNKKKIDKQRQSLLHGRWAKTRIKNEPKFLFLFCDDLCIWNIDIEAKAVIDFHNFSLHGTLVTLLSLK